MSSVPRPSCSSEWMERHLERYDEVFRALFPVEGNAHVHGGRRHEGVAPGF